MEIPNEISILSASSLVAWYKANPEAYRGWTGLGSNMIDQMFPDVFTGELNLTYIKGVNKRSVMLRNAEVGTNGFTRNKGSIDMMEFKIPLFRENMEMDEVELDKFYESIYNLPRFIPASQYAENMAEISKRYYADYGALIDGANLAKRVMRHQLISTGKITLEINSDTVEYDYGMNANQKEALTGSDAWTDIVNSDPFQDIKDTKHNYRVEESIILTDIFISWTTFQLMVSNEKVIKKLNEGNVIANDASIAAYIKNNFNINLHIIDEIYSDFDGTSKLLFPDNEVSFTAGGTMGSTYYTVPYSKRFQDSGAFTGRDLADAGNGVVAISKYVQDPNKLKYTVELMSLVTAPALQDLFILTVA